MRANAWRASAYSGRCAACVRGSEKAPARTETRNARGAKWSCSRRTAHAIRLAPEVPSPLRRRSMRLHVFALLLAAQVGGQLGAASPHSAIGNFHLLSVGAG